MRVLRNLFLAFLILALLTGTLLLVEHLTRQELTRITNPSTEATACLIWQPRFFRDQGQCLLALKNPGGKTVDTVPLAPVTSGFEALQQFGGLSFQGEDIVVADRRTGNVVRRFQVHEDRLLSSD